MRTGIDISENEIAKQYPDVLDILLRDHTTKKNIFWATDNYAYLGEAFSFNAQILPELITGENGNIYDTRSSQSQINAINKVKRNGRIIYPHLRDFTHNSDIDWSKSIPEIDQNISK